MSKLILAIIFNTDAVDPLLQALLEQDYSVTKVSSTGGFLRRDNTTFVIGVKEERLPGAMAIIACQSAAVIVARITCHSLFK